MAQAFFRPIDVGLMISHFCLVYPCVHIFYVVFHLSGKNPRHDCIKGEFLGSAPFVCEYYFGAALGLVSDRAAAKLGKRRGRQSHGVDWHSVLGSIAVVRHATRRATR